MAKQQGGATAYQDLVRDMRRDIRSGQFPPGARLKVAELARIYRTSTMPVRQALVELESKGLVSFSLNRGAIVRVLDEDLVNELCDLRSAILGLVLRRFVERAEAEDVDVLERLEDRLDAAIDGEERMEVNDLFFDHLMVVARTKEAAEALDRTWPLLNPAFRYFGSRDREAIGRNHRGIIAAARRGDGDEAVRLAQSAVEATRAHILAKIRDQQAS